MNFMKKCALMVVVLCCLVCVTGFAAGNAVEEIPDLGMVIHGKSVTLQNVPISLNSRTLIPLREILVNIGVPNDNEHILWNDAEKSVTVRHNGHTVILLLGRYDIVIDGRTEKMDVCPVLYGEFTYIPARFIAQSLGMKVAWDEYSSTVAICSEENFNTVKNILTNSDTTLMGAKKFKSDQTYKGETSLTILTASMKNSIDMSTMVQVDRANEEAYAKTVSQTKLNDKQEDMTLETRFEKDQVSFRQQPSSQWQDYDVDASMIEFEKKKVFDVYYFLKPTDFNCTALVAAPQVDGKLVLKGEFFPFELAESINEGFSILGKEGTKQLVEDGDVEINYLSADQLISSVSVKGHITSGEDAISSQTNYSYSWTVYDINKEFAPTTTTSNVVPQGDFDTAYKLFEEGKYEEAAAILNVVTQKDSTNLDAFFVLAMCQSRMDEYDASNKNIDRCIEMYPDDDELYVFKADNFCRLKKFQKAIELCNIAIDKNAYSSVAYSTKGYALTELGKYDEALNSLDRAIGLDGDNEGAYLNKVWALYQKEDYKGCIEFAKKIGEKFPEHKEFPWYKADSYAALEDYKNATIAMEDVLRLAPDNSYAYSDAGWCYLYDNNSEKALAYAQKALGLDPENKSAKDLAEAAQQATLPEAERIVNFVKKNYLYFDKIQGFEEKSKIFLAKKDVTTEDVGRFIESIRWKEDMFTGTIGGDDYKKYEEEDEITHIETKQLKDGVHYVTFDSFTSSIGTEFEQFVDGLANTEQATLVIDLRDNGGGRMDSANQMLDKLLGKCTTMELKDKQGVVESYYSDEAKVSFKKIYILINERSASASELLALGLKTYLDNVTIIGKPTFGKGVGQFTFADDSEDYIIFLVNFYWSVQDKNIVGKNVAPDITMDDAAIEVFLKGLV